MWTKRLSRPIPPLFESMVDTGIFSWSAFALGFPFRFSARKLVGNEIFYKTDELQQLKELLTKHILQDPCYLNRFAVRCWAQSVLLELVTRHLRYTYIKENNVIDSSTVLDGRNLVKLQRLWASFVSQFTRTAPFLAIFPAALDDVLWELRPSLLTMPAPSVESFGRRLQTYSALESAAYGEILTDVRQWRNLIDPNDAAILEVSAFPSALVSQLESYVRNFGWLHLNYFTGQPLTLSDVLQRISEDQNDPLPTTYEPLEDLTIVDLLGKVRAFRKDCMELAGFYMRPIFRAIADAGTIDHADLLYLTAEEVANYLDRGSNDLRDAIARRNRYVSVIMENGRITIQTSDFPEVRESSSESECLAGFIGSSGQWEGTARVLQDSLQSSLVQRGDVLIVHVLTPDYVVAYDRAGAVVTDEAGLTSHAVRVSRERQIPCLVGTMEATRVFRDGDRVFIDATGSERGTIRRVHEMQDRR
jgi:phosphohistidine swiveling domain-containing protein